MEEPKTEEVLRNIYDLYENPDPASKEKASAWLAEFQKSVSVKFNKHAKRFFS
jgi:transportin-3